MKKILIQLDTDQHPSAFDAIAAYDADVDVVPVAAEHGGITGNDVGQRHSPIPGQKTPGQSDRRVAARTEVHTHDDLAEHRPMTVRRNHPRAIRERRLPAPRSRAAIGPAGG